MRIIVLALVVVGCGPTLAQRHEQARQAAEVKRLAAMDDHCWKVVQSQTAAPDEKAHCYAWLQASIGRQTAQLQVQAAAHQQQAADTAAMMQTMEVIRAQMPPPPPPRQLIYTTCSQMPGTESINCTSY